MFGSIKDLCRKLGAVKESLTTTIKYVEKIYLLMWTLMDALYA